MIELKNHFWPLAFEDKCKMTLISQWGCTEEKREHDTTEIANKGGKQSKKKKIHKRVKMTRSNTSAN